VARGIVVQLRQVVLQRFDVVMFFGQRVHLFYAHEVRLSVLPDGAMFALLPQHGVVWEAVAFFPQKGVADSAFTLVLGFSRDCSHALQIWISYNQFKKTKSKLTRLKLLISKQYLNYLHMVSLRCTY